MYLRSGTPLSGKNKSMARILLTTLKSDEGILRGLKRSFLGTKMVLRKDQGSAREIYMQSTPLRAGAEVLGLGRG